MAMESYTTGTGQVLWVHTKSTCDAEPRQDRWCVIHARKPSRMRDWPTHWRTDWSGFMEVLCPHGIGHPAPENSGRAHGCDGCCVEKEVEMSKPHIHTGAATDPQPYLVRQGGLMRCCLLTLANLPEHAHTEAVEGLVNSCDYCSSSMIFTGGAWEWSKARSR